jgi:hypothetical protein
VGTKEEAAQFARSKFKPKARSEEETGSADSGTKGLRGVGKS